MFCSLILSCDIGVGEKYLRAERPSEFLVLIVSVPEIKSPSSFSGWLTIHCKQRDATQERSTKRARLVRCGQETASDTIYCRCSISRHDSQVMLYLNTWEHESQFVGTHYDIIDEEFSMFLITYSRIKHIFDFVWEMGCMHFCELPLLVCIIMQFIFYIPNVSCFIVCNHNTSLTFIRSKSDLLSKDKIMTALIWH